MKYIETNPIDQFETFRNSQARLTLCAVVTKLPAKQLLFCW